MIIKDRKIKTVRIKGELFVDLRLIEGQLESFYSELAEKNRYSQENSKKANKTYRLACKFALSLVHEILVGDRPATSKAQVLSNFQGLARVEKVILTEGEVQDRSKRYSKATQKKQRSKPLNKAPRTRTNQRPLKSKILLGLSNRRFDRLRHQDLLAELMF